MVVIGNYNHVHLVSTDPDATAQWYVKCLEAEIFDLGELQGARNVRMKVGDSNLYVRGVRPTDKIAGNGDSQVYGLDHISFTVEGLEEMLVDVEKNGGEITRPIFTTPRGNRAAYVQGPNNVTIELIEMQMG